MKKQNKIALALAAGAAALYVAVKNKSVSGIGAADGYLIEISETYRNNTTRYIFAGWAYSNGEHWARLYRIGANYNEFDEKIYKSLKAAEKAIPQIISKIDDGVSEYSARVITWSEYLNKYVR